MVFQTKTDRTKTESTPKSPQNQPTQGQLTPKQIKALDPEQRIKYVAAMELQAKCKRIGGEIVRILGDVPIQIGLNILAATSNSLLGQGQKLFNTMSVDEAFIAEEEDVTVNFKDNG